MTLSNELFARAVNWLIDNRKVEDQQDLSLKTGITETTISRIMNDRVKKPSEETIKKLLDAFPGVFNPEYFRGQNIYMLMQDVIDAKIANNEKKEELNKSTIDQSSLINAALAAKDQVIAQMELRLSEKDETIRTQRQLIQSLQQQIADLRTKMQQEKISDYPFDMGVAEVPKTPENRRA